MNIKIIVVLIGIGVALFGMLFVYIGKKAKSCVSGFRSKCVLETSGIVTQMEKRRIGVKSEIDDYTWYPHYEFYVNGERIECIGAVGLAKNVLHENQQVTICYNPDDYTQVYAKEETSENALGLFSLVGWLFVVIGILTAIIGILFV